MGICQIKIFDFWPNFDYLLLTKENIDKDY